MNHICYCILAWYQTTDRVVNTLVHVPLQSDCLHSNRFPWWRNRHFLSWCQTRSTWLGGVICNLMFPVYGLWLVMLACQSRRLPDKEAVLDSYSALCPSLPQASGWTLKVVPSGRFHGRDRVAAVQPPQRVTRLAGRGQPGAAALLRTDRRAQWLHVPLHVPQPLHWPARHGRNHHPAGSGQVLPPHTHRHTHSLLVLAINWLLIANYALTDPSLQ